MITLLSPAKIQNFTPNDNILSTTLPPYLSMSEHIIKAIRQCSPIELSKILKINHKIAEQTIASHSRWHTSHTTTNSKASGWVFNGEAYRGLDINSFSAHDIEYAQQHLRILSGLYGILRPLDLIQPYRIDIGDNINQLLGENLYQYWKYAINSSLVQALEHSTTPKIILNLMSKEYAKILDRKRIEANIIDVDFLQYNPQKEQYKPTVVYIKKARGLLARFAIQNKITDVEQIKGFDEEGYIFSEKDSTANKLVFLR